MTRTVVILLAVVTAVGCSRPRDDAVPAGPATPARTYPEALADVEARRQHLQEQYSAAKNPRDREGVIASARRCFVQLVSEDLLPRWYGTPWDFHGTTQVPGVGKIACGYFVTTVLRDAGLKVDRAPLARQASERIIKSLVEERHIRRFRGVPIADFLASVAATGPGLYVVGLDRHVGFLLLDDEGACFIHSSPYPPRAVVSEPASASRSLAESAYRVTGKLSDSDDLLLKWLQASPIPTYTP